MPETSRPPSRIVPDVGSTVRLIMRSDVVLPHPDGPTNCDEPGWAVQVEVGHGVGAVRKPLSHTLERHGLSGGTTAS